MSQTDRSFKKSLFGFRSRDVLDYIETMQADMVREKEELAGELETLSARVKELEAAAAQAEAAKQDAESACDTLRAELAASRETVASLEDTVRAQRESIESSTELSGQIGDIFLDAKNAANQLLDAARADADALEQSAAACADTMLGSIDGTYASLAALRDSLQAVFDEFSSRLTGAGASLLSAKDQVEAAKRHTRRDAQDRVKPAAPAAESAANVVALGEAVPQNPGPDTITSVRYL